LLGYLRQFYQNKFLDQEKHTRVDILAEPRLLLSLQKLYDYQQGDGRGVFRQRSEQSEQLWRPGFPRFLQQHHERQQVHQLSRSSLLPGLLSFLQKFYELQVADFRKHATTSEGLKRVGGSSNSCQKHQLDHVSRERFSQQGMTSGASEESCDCVRNEFSPQTGASIGSLNNPVFLDEMYAEDPNSRLDRVIAIYSKVYAIARMVFRVCRRYEIMVRQTLPF
jgi:hypothetical protein